VTTAAIFLESGLIFQGVNFPVATTALSVSLLLDFIALIFTLNGSPGFAKLVIPPSLIAIIVIIAINANGAHDVSMMVFPVIIIISVLLNKKRSIYIITPAVILGAEIVVYADIAGINKSVSAQFTDSADIFIVAFILISTSALLQLVTSRLIDATTEARNRAAQQESANQELEELKNALEVRVEERTSELASLNTINERRNSQFQAISQVARAVASLQELEDLLPAITRLISNRFGYYHVGIFLLDELKQYAVLSAANSEGGQRLLEKGHRLRAGEVGIVGYTASTGIPRIALDTGADAVYFSNPDLPETRSEIALPLQISNNLIGVLDVQSTEQNAFVQEDIETLSTLADQVAIAIRNAELYRQSQVSIADSQVFMGNYLLDLWKNASKRDVELGYRFLGATPTPLLEPSDSPEIRQALHEGRMISATQGRNSILAIPIKIRDEAIGIVKINLPEQRDWDLDELDVIQATVQRTALALENAVLIEETQRRASKERIISDISAKISGSLEMDNLLQTAIQEVARAIPGAEVAIQLQNESDRQVKQ
jgi:GAF domain-containing protein